MDMTPGARHAGASTRKREESVESKKKLDAKELGALQSKAVKEAMEELTGVAHNYYGVNKKARNAAKRLRRSRA